MSSFLARVQLIKLQASILGLYWNDWGAHGRGKVLLGLLDVDFDNHQDTSVYDLYVKTHQTLHYHLLSNGTHMMDMDFNHDKLMKIFDLMEKYAKNWMFS